MVDRARFSLDIEAPLRDAFLAEASALDRLAGHIVRELIKDFVDRQQAARDREAWF